MPTENFSAASSKTLGVCWILYGALRFVACAVLVIFAPTATVMFGALLTRVVDPFSLMGMFHVWYWAVILWAAASGILSIIAGFGLLSGGQSARGLAILASLFALPDLPLGVILGTYTLVEAKTSSLRAA